MFVANQRFSWLRVAVPICVATLVLFGGWGLVTSNQPAEDQLTSEFEVAQQQAIALTNRFNVEASPRWRPVDPVIGGMMALGDINQDGTVDIFAGTNGQLFLSQAASNTNSDELSLNRSPVTLGGGNNLDTALVDIDKDNDLDIVIASTLQRKNGSAILINPGADSGINNRENWRQINITDVSYDKPDDEGDFYQDVETADFDNDGDYDLVFAGIFGGKARFGLYENQISETAGVSLTFKSILPDLLIGANALEVGDIDGDQKIDLIAVRSGFIDADPNSNTQGASIQGELTVCKNTTTADISFSCTDLGVSIAGGAKSLKLGDVDNDQLLDLIVGDGTNVHLYKNKMGSFNPNSKVTMNALNPARSVDLGDMDNDGDLDLLVGLNLFINNGGSFSVSPVWQPFESISVEKSALVDMDGDNDLDVVASGKGPVLVYLNQGQLLPSDARSVVAQNSFTESGKMASFSSSAGDVNNDGRQDLVLGRAFGADGEFFLHNTVRINRWAPAQNILLINKEGKLQVDPTWNPASTRVTLATAWGDVDNDGDLDLAVANRPYSADPDAPVSGKNEIYINVDGVLSDTPYEFGSADGQSQDIKWADINQDGRLDLIVANVSTSDQIFLNQSVAVDAPTLITSTWTTSRDQLRSEGISIANGDIDGDSFVDIIIGRVNTVDVYMNQNGEIPNEPTASLSPGANEFNFNEVDLTDVDRDGDLDLTVSATSRPIRLYDNVGGQFIANPIWESAATEHYNNVRYADLNNDGYPELLSASANAGINIKTETNIKAWLNNNGTLSPDIHWKSGEALRQFDFAPVDINLDGLIDIIQPGDDGNLFIYDSLRPASADAQPKASAAILSKSTAARGANTSYQSGPISITYQLSNTAGSGFSSVHFEYSLTEGANWLPADPVSETILALDNGTHTFLWDVTQSGFFGRADNIVLRLTAVPQNDFTATPETALIPAVTAQSTPLNVSGSQIQVVSTEGVGVENAIVFYKGAHSSEPARPFIDASGNLLTTNQTGTLFDSGLLNQNDQLIALELVQQHYKLPVYLMSGTPTEAGIDMSRVVSNSTESVVTMTDDQFLMLINLSISLEWDASQDADYLVRLTEDLHRTSEIIFDLTNGQAALGDIDVYMDKAFWDLADVQVLADNNHRPNAALGGIVSSPISETVKISRTSSLTTVVSNAIQPGQIRMAATWNRYGQPGGTLGEDWPRTLAHELGHFVFFQMDNYLGVKEDGTLVTPDCPGSAMTDAYRPDFSEFLSRSENGDRYEWNDTCAQTIAELTTGRTDWETVTAFYPFMSENITQTGTGPNTLPLEVTSIEIFYDQTETTQPLADPIFYTQNENGQAIIFDRGRAQAYLYTRNGTPAILEDDDLIPLGSPFGQTLNARGAKADDRLCIFAEKSIPSQAGCGILSPDSNGVTMREVTNWQPDIIVRPVNSVTLAVTATLPAGTSITELNAQIFPGFRPTDTIRAETVTLTQIDSTTFAGELEFPITIFHGFARVWDKTGSENDIRETITQFAISMGQTITGEIVPPTPDGITTLTDYSDSLGIEIGRLVGSPTGRVGGFTTSRAEGDTTGRVGGFTTSRGQGDTTGRVGGFTTSRAEGDTTGRVGGFTTSRTQGDTTGRVGGFTASRAQGDPTGRVGGFTTSRVQGDPTGRVGGFTTSRAQGDATGRVGGFTTSRVQGDPTGRVGGFTTSRAQGDATGRVGGFTTNQNLTFNAPIASPDGQVMLFNTANVLAPVPATELQKLSFSPDVPSWLTPIGQIYRYGSGEDSGSDIAMQFLYFNRDLAGVSEDQLTIFFLQNGANETSWQPLSTTLDVDRNQASALTKGNGLYALMATTELPTLTEGWNLIGNPVNGSLPITTALNSISGSYSIVYGFNEAKQSWDAFDPAIASNNNFSSTNTLTNLDFGNGYLIYAIKETPFYLPVSASSSLTASDIVSDITAVNLSTPPAIIYGELPSLNSNDSNTSPQFEVTFDSSDCSFEAEILPNANGYRLEVFADECQVISGISAIEIQLNGMSQTLIWTNQEMTRIDW